MAVIVEVQREDLQWQLTHARQVQRNFNLARQSRLEEKIENSRETNLIGGLQIYSVGEATCSLRSSNAADGDMGRLKVPARRSHTKKGSLAFTPDTHRKTSSKCRMRSSNIIVFAMPNEDADYPSESYINVIYQDITHLMDELNLTF
ncbi:uncharacterized protein LOC134855387 [Symsagittifera roscoffensis]|uniref:uncharacterized protein LOC134855387 n=1 Tax=Symsagittifera roscoffensis TaxID=84072 RepID=UPI00307C9AC8